MSPAAMPPSALVGRLRCGAWPWGCWRRCPWLGCNQTPSVVPSPSVRDGCSVGLWLWAPSVAGPGRPAA
eukprot:11185491-Lingulodinium_polyedra.AAC.2